MLAPLHPGAYMSISIYIGIHRCTYVNRCLTYTYIYNLRKVSSRPDVQVSKPAGFSSQGDKGPHWSRCTCVPTATVLCWAGRVGRGKAPVEGWKTPETTTGTSPSQQDRTTNREKQKRGERTGRRAAAARRFAQRAAQALRRPCRAVFTCGT